MNFIFSMRSINQNFLQHRHKVVRPLAYIFLFVALIVGSSLRGLDVKNHFEINNGFEFYVEMASHFWTEPGGYNFENGLTIINEPESYVFTRKPRVAATGSFENEKGWMFYLSLIFSEGQKGLTNLAETVVFYNIIWDLLVLVSLFYSGRAVAGTSGGVFSALLYALFIPSIRQVSWVSYYYWAIPFSAFSLFFWTVIYRPEEKCIPLPRALSMFFLYGAMIGFATFERLGFLLLPLALAPMIFIRERNLKRGLALVTIMLIGQGILLVPQMKITEKWFGEFTLSTRGGWHHVISGLGSHPNPWGIKDGADLTAVKWAIDRGGPDLNAPGVGIVPYDRFMKNKVFVFFKERPEIFWINFTKNLYRGVTLTPNGGVRSMGGPQFHFLLDSEKKGEEILPKRVFQFSRLYPWIVGAGFLVLFFFHHSRFLLLFNVALQGLILLGILCLYFPPIDVHVTSFYPVFILLLGISLAVIFRFGLATIGGLFQCLMGKKTFKNFPTYFRESFSESWDQPQPAFDFASRAKNESHFNKTPWVYGFIGLTVFIIIIDQWAKQTWADSTRSNAINFKTIYNFNNLGNFETWNDQKPKGWVYEYKYSGLKAAPATEESQVKLGETSLRLKADKKNLAKIFIQITPDQIYHLSGKTINLLAWVKSDNTAHNAVSMHIINGNDSTQFPIAYYKNSGNWEKLSITYQVPDSGIFFVVLKASKGTEDPVFFDRVSLKLAGSTESIPTLQIIHDAKKMNDDTLLALKNKQYAVAWSNYNQMIDSHPNSELLPTLKTQIGLIENSFGISLRELARAQTIWEFDDSQSLPIKDSTGKYPALAFKTKWVAGYSGKGLRFDGIQSYVHTPVSFKEWNGVTLSFWVKPEPKQEKDLSVILDNGHDAKNNFAFQSAGPGGDKWVWYCNGTSIILTLPLNQWSHVKLTANGNTGEISAHLNGKIVARVYIPNGFNFGSTPLMIGKLANQNSRYFKGAIDQMVILKID